MKRITTFLSVLIAATLFFVAPQGKAQNYDYDDDQPQRLSRQEHDNDNYAREDRSRVDRYLDVEVWTNDDDGEYYVGDKIVLSFRANRDAFVAIYSIDTRGRVNLLFPTDRSGDNYIRGGTTYRMPDNTDDFDLVVDGPSGVENIQIIASRERFPIPDWYPESGLTSDAEDRHDYMDYLNERYFIRYEGQRFSYDRTAAYVYEWEPEYFRPVYYPDYPSWTIVGNAYFDYPFGSSVYVNGIYWGTTPLYIPRIYVGWHTVTIYDEYGRCWENDFHVTRYHTVVFDRFHIRTSASIKSKYRDVRLAGYRDPVHMGYRDYTHKKSLIASTRGVSAIKGQVRGDKNVRKTDWNVSSKKKYVRGTTDLVQTKRGWESDGSKSIKGSKQGTSTGGYSGKVKSKGSTGQTYDRSKKSGATYKRSDGSSTSKKSGSYDRKSSSGKSGSYYQKKSGTYKKSSGSSSYKKSKSAKSSSKSKVSQKKSTKSSKSSTVAPKKSPQKSSKSSGGSKRSTYDKSSKSKSSSSSSGKSSSSKKSSGSSKKGKGR